MKCDNCGKELSLIRSLSREESQDVIYAKHKINSAKEALNPDIFNSLNLDNDGIYSYFKAVYDNLCEGEFLYYIAVKEITDKIKEETGIEYNSNNLFINDVGVYLHPNA